MFLFFVVSAFLCECINVNYLMDLLLLFQAKHLCLAMARTAILERRPVTMVAKAIDVLVTSYSNSFKTGYFKGTKAEKAQASGAAYATVHGTGANASRSDTTGKSVEHEYVVGLDGESFERSTFSETDSDENGNTGYVKPNSNGSGSKLLLGVETRRTGGQTSLHSENVGASNHILRSTLQPEPQVTSPAVSPDEMYTYVFAPVEEEMAGDPSYLVAVIVEFLRRYLTNECLCCLGETIYALLPKIFIHPMHPLWCSMLAVLRGLKRILSH